MKITAGLQICLGLFATYAACCLAIFKNSSVGNVTIPHSSPTYYFEIGLIIVGLAIFGLALAQHIKHIKLATLQLICGQDIIILSFVLYRSALAYAYGYKPEVYWLVFVVIGTALLVVISGIIQLLKGDR